MARVLARELHGDIVMRIAIAPKGRPPVNADGRGPQIPHRIANVTFVEVHDQPQNTDNQSDGQSESQERHCDFNDRGRMIHGY